jgi:hypothetical protein
MSLEVTFLYALLASKHSRAFALFMMITGLLLMSTLKEDATGVGLVANMGM